ncbi:MAG: tryptophan synthase subunit alpha [Gammaproteobacteria bacterium]|nr:tryptophan synthase subunit alpha [Gammaproteobacteria bacterium]
MSRISKKFQSLKSENKTCLISYVTAGDPSLTDSLHIMKTLVDSGTDIIELGVPFSDPMADGPTIQRACERALSQNTSCIDIFELVRNFRKENNETPIVLMGYLNPIERMGYELFAKLASQSGVDAILVVDLPHEEAKDVITVFKKYNLESIFLIAPNTKINRIKEILKYASGFLYYVSLKGVTGAATLDVVKTIEQLNSIKESIDLPLAVGFGIKDAKTAKILSSAADAIVIGSAIVNIIEKELNNKSKVNNDIMKLMRPIRTKLDESIAFGDKA